MTLETIAKTVAEQIRRKEYIEPSRTMMQTA